MSVFCGLGDDLITAPPSITTLITGPESTAQDIIFGAQLGSENAQAQIAAAGQGFLTAGSISAWISAYWPYLAGAGFLLLLFTHSGGPRRYGP